MTAARANDRYFNQNDRYWQKQLYNIRVFFAMIGDPRTRTDHYRPGPTMFRKSQTGADHNQHELENLGPGKTQEKFENLGRNRTRTHKTKKVLDQVGSIGPRNWRSIHPWS